MAISFIFSQEPPVGSHTTLRGHLCVPLATEYPNVFIREFDSFMEHPPYAGFLLSCIMSSVQRGICPSRQVALVSWRIGRGDYGASSVLA